MRALSLEGARGGVLVNAIAPYATTQMTQALTPAELHAPLDPDRVAPIAAWLVSERLRRSGEGDSIESLVASLDASAAFRPMASAQAEFADFVAALGLSV